MKNRILTTALILLVISATFGVAMFGLNFITGPMIEANNAGAEFAPLLAVMPEGAEFDGDALIYDSENPSASALKNVPASVLSIYQEKNGLGFAIRATATSGYTTSPLVMTIGVTADGKICGIQIDNYGDEAGSNWNKKILTNEYIGTYVGQDSALGDVELIANPTSDKASSVAFKNGVAAALEALIANDLITEGVKTDAKILEDLIPTVSNFGMLTEATTPGGNIQKALKANNDAGFALIMTEGEASYLAVVNASGACKLYDVNGNVVENAALTEEAQTYAKANQKNYVDALETKVSKMLGMVPDFETLTIDTFNSVVVAVSFQLDGATYYAFQARPYGFDQMDIYYIIDENGAIYKFDAKVLIFGTDHFHGYEYPAGSEGAYEDGFVGENIESWTGDEALISHATMTTNAVKTATADVFAAFESIKGGEQ